MKRPRLLNRKRRERTREVALDFLLARPGLRAMAGDPEMESEILQALESRLAKEPVFQSFVASFLISIAAKLAWELIKYWIQMNLLAVRIPRHYQAGEPGYGE